MSKKRYSILVIFCFCILIGQISADNLRESSQGHYSIIETTIYVNEGQYQFYDYTVITQDGNILLNITDQNLTHHTLKFDKTNQLFFSAAYYKFIIVEQKNSTDSICYWVLEIVKAQTGYNIITFSLNSQVDNTGFQLNNDYFLDSIIEYNQFTNYLYVLVEEQTINIYGIDIQNQSPQLISISRYSPDQQNSDEQNYDTENSGEQNPLNIIGGNSRVLVQPSKDQLWFDTQNPRYNNTQLTIFNITDIQKITPLPIYPGESRVYDLMDSYFEYVSITNDSLEMSAFVYEGYGYQKIRGEVNYISKKPIQIFSDSYNYFIAVFDTDIYLTIIDWNQTVKNYTAYINTMQNSVSDTSIYEQTINNFISATWIVYNNHKLYLLTIDKFYVYGDKTYFSKLYETNLSTNPNNTSVVDSMFTQIKVYEDIKQ